MVLWCVRHRTTFIWFILTSVQVYIGRIRKDLNKSCQQVRQGIISSGDLLNQDANNKRFVILLQFSFNHLQILFNIFNCLCV